METDTEMQPACEYQQLDHDPSSSSSDDLPPQRAASTPPSSDCEADLPDPASTAPAPTSSRRVILTQLSRDATLCQVLKTVRRRGDIIECGIYDTSRLAGCGHQMACLEFSSPAAAAAYVASARRHPPGLVDACGSTCFPEVWLSCAAASAPCSGQKANFLRFGFTRTLVAPEFPAKAVWFCLSVLGLGSITDAGYDMPTSTLTVEFASIFQAVRAVRLLADGRFPYYACRHEEQLIAPPRQDADAGCAAVVPHVPPDHLDRRFNRLPYSQTWPTSRLPVMRDRGLAPRSELDADVMLATLQRRASLSRGSWSWEAAPPDVLGTLDDPLWRDAWDAYFSANRHRTNNILRWAAYASVARHRREMAAGQGRGPREVPACSGCCAFGCGETEVVPQVVREYHERPVVTIRRNPARAFD